MGMRIRLDMKPGKSLASTGIFSSFSVRSLVFRKVSSDVARPLMISTNFMAGTGFMKCIPITLSGRVVAEAILVMEMEEVLLERMVSFRHMPSNSLNMSNFRSSSSVAASTMKSAFFIFPMSIVPSIPSMICFFWEGGIFCF